MDVIGVGGINFEDEIARFSSRGMTTWVSHHTHYQLSDSWYDQGSKGCINPPKKGEKCAFGKI